MDPSFKSLAIMRGAKECPPLALSTSNAAGEHSAPLSSPVKSSSPVTTINPAFTMDSSEEDVDDLDSFQKRVKSFDEKYSQSSRSLKYATLEQMAGEDLNGIGGTIESVELTNFMCHERLRVELQENINFIVGNNGSGKSAVLTALTVCLGARASSTQRGNSLESLIKEGAVEARVAVAISNRGVMKFKPDLYGDSILIERRFRRNAAASGPTNSSSSTSSYRTKSGDGRRVVSEKKDEVVAICDNFNIQVDNPLVILTQETAKKFLVNSTPQDLYDFFMRGTQLEQLSIDYSYALDRMKSMQNSLQAARDSWPGLEEKLGLLKVDLESANRQKELLERKALFQAESIWRRVKDLELNVKNQQQRVEGRQEELSQVQEEKDALQFRHEELRLKVTAVDSEISEIFRRRAPFHQRLESLRREIAKAERSKADCEKDAYEINREVTELRKKINEIETEMTKELEESGAEEVQKMMEQIGELEVALSANFRQQKEIEEKSLPAFAPAIQDLEATLGNAKSALKHYEADVTQVTEDFEEAKASVKDRLKFYGHGIPELLKHLKQHAADFHHPPVGPIGMHIKLKNLEWTLPMEAIIGSHLKSFIVFDLHDRQVLTEKLRLFQADSPIITLKLGALDISSGEPAAHFTTALRALEIENAAVKKALVLFTGLEKKLLFADRLQAQQVMRERHPNVDSAYTTSHRIVSTAQSLSFFAIYRSSRTNPFASGEERVRLLARELQDRENVMAVARRDVIQLETRLSELQAQERQKRQELSRLRIEDLRLKNEIEKIEEAIQEDSASVSFEVLRGERDAAKARSETFKKQFRDIADRSVQCTEQISTLHAEKTALEEDYERASQELNEKESLIASLNQDLFGLRRSLDRSQQRVASLQTILSDEENSVNQIRLEAQGIMDEAFKASEEVVKLNPNLDTQHVQDKPRAKTKIDRELLTVEEALKTTRVISPQEVDQLRVQYEDLRAELRKSRENIKINQGILDEMKIALDKRQRQWEDLRRGIAKRSNHDFSTALQARGFRGQLDYDHAAGELRINVHIDGMSDLTNHLPEDREALERRDIKQLSGGEKSFGTTCFLLSLWDAMGCPIRCLDEFDVYMDAINRRMVVEMLINNAKNSGTQFILITPVSVRNYLDQHGQNSIHMVQLKSPDRVQQQ